MSTCPGGVEQRTDPNRICTLHSGRYGAGWELGSVVQRAEASGLVRPGVDPGKEFRPGHQMAKVPALPEIFDRHPRVSRTVYLVDEEFIGRDPDAAERALAVATTVHEAGFRWETSCRIDQVVWPDRDEVWHTDRVQMWRDLLGRGLRRCLFGVESGVTSILQRFNKEMTAEQNALAIRTLSALGVPTRTRTSRSTT
jgi:hypothetical protein